MRVSLLRLGTVLLGLVSVLGLGPAFACGADSPCDVRGGDYRIRMPSNWDGERKVGAIVYFHGWQATADGVMRNTGLKAVADDLGVALIAPHGAGKTWSYPGSPSQRRDEFTFMDAVLDDVLARFPVDPEAIVASGFSMGGSMVWNLACYRGERFAGFVPIAGAFWEPLPEDCPSPQPLMVHVHGLSDTVVPYEGRPIGESWRQGDVAQSIDIWLAQGQCEMRASVRAAMPEMVGALDCSRQYACGGGMIELCVHDGGHSIRPEWVRRAWTRLDALRNAQ